jgi:hypothetical protein
MKIDFLKSKIRTPFLAGLLIISFFVLLTFWLYTNFLISQDDFLNYAPAETVIYWHSFPAKNVDNVWLYDLTRRVLSGGASDQAKFLFENVAPETEEMSLAVLPGLEDFIFWGRLDASGFNKLKEKLENSNFNYIYEDEGKITITNTKFGLKEILAVLSQKNFSLSDQKIRLIAFNRAYRRFPTQIYIRGNFKFGDFYPLKLKSDFWETNQLKVARKNYELPPGAGDYNYLVTADNEYLVKEAKNILKNNLAVAFPEIKEKELSDKTVVREIIANPEKFSFEKIKVGGEEINYLKTPVINEEFFIFETDDSAAASNSRDLLANYLVRQNPREKYYGKNILDFLLSLAKWVTNDFNGVVFGVGVEAP